MKFSKMHGCGNDYIYLNCFEENIHDRPYLSRVLSDRHFGIGSDGLICICPSDVADYKMDMYNADGSHAQMCGNGIRCLAKYVYDNKMTEKTVLDVETGAGVLRLWLNVEDGNVSTVRVSMGSPNFRCAEIPVISDTEEYINVPMEIGGLIWNVTALSVGNPHAVVFVDDVDWLDLPEIGPQFENHPAFPERINTEFVQVIDENNLKMRVWERGSGETLACGTGSTAALAAAVVTGKSNNSATLRLLGGDLFIEWDRNENIIYMTGPASHVFDGEIEIEGYV
ncbi:MAG: diaminopimelate epimerase [Ruminococcaceae bacterium]|nr:diaminopimelate epimerase [Oscillospiraceae bacterium]